MHLDLEIECCMMMLAAVFGPRGLKQTKHLRL